MHSKYTIPVQNVVGPCGIILSCEKIHSSISFLDVIVKITVIRRYDFFRLYLITYFSPFISFLPKYCVFLSDTHTKRFSSRNSCAQQIIGECAKVTWCMEHWLWCGTLHLDQNLLPFCPLEVQFLDNSAWKTKQLLWICECVFIVARKRSTKKMYLEQGLESLLYASVKLSYVCLFICDFIYFIWYDICHDVRIFPGRCPLCGEGVISAAFRRLDFFCLGWKQPDWNIVDTT